ncbi:MAG: hypothetical protein Q7R81_01440 [Candidatus Peregrinibacteria bacterium]|nr:hypothetical protein [Candidatus Peregrinibacteria bacterium]
MSDIVTVAKDGNTYALFIPKGTPVDGIKFLTEQTSPMQVGLMERPAGHAVKAHQHPPQKFDVGRLSEFLYIEKGKIHVHVFDEEWKELADQILNAGDFLVFLRGGHSIDMLEPTRMIEVKQGPFPGDKQSKSFRN